LTSNALSDYHVHTKWCGHATGEVYEYVEAAIARGLSEIGLSEHLPMPIPGDDKINLTDEEMDIFIREVDQARERYRGDITVKLGGECDYFPDEEELIDSIIRRYPFDYVIGSLHYLGDWGFDNERYMHVYDERCVMDIYREYFSTAVSAVRSGFFDIFGHIDVVKKFGHFPDEDYSHLHRELAQALSDQGMSFEINTAGKDKPVGEIYPSESLLCQLATLKVPATLGSDAHAPEQVGRYFDQAVRLLKKCGITGLARFDRRVRTVEPLS